MVSTAKVTGETGQELPGEAIERAWKVHGNGECRRLMLPRSIDDDRLSRQIIEREVALSSFLEDEQERIASACFDMACAFNRGGRLIVFGTGPAAIDAARLAADFTHPVIRGKRVLPALARSNNPTGAIRLAAMARPDDIALGLIHSREDPAVERFLSAAERRGLLTVALGAATRRNPSRLSGRVDHALIVPGADPFLVQELQRTTYHVLWELVQIFLQHPGLLSDAGIASGEVAFSARVLALSHGIATVDRSGFVEEIAIDGIDEVAVGDLLRCRAGVALQKLEHQGERCATDPTDYPHPLRGSWEDDFDAVLATVCASALRHGSDVSALRRTIDLLALERCAAVARQRLDRGGRLISFGNDYSSADAEEVATHCQARGWPAIALTQDPAAIAPAGDDLGLDKALARQPVPIASSEDIALAIFSSGSAVSVVAGLEEAHRRHMLTCAITGDDGGQIAGLDWLDYVFVLRDDDIPRLHEVQATICHLLLDAIGERRSRAIQ